MQPQKHTMRLISILILSAMTFSSAGQTTLTEDSLTQAGKKSVTYLGGYGNFIYQNNVNESSSTLNLDRVVIFLGHRFNEKISFLSEIEIEDAKVSGGEEGGEVAIEQAYLKFNLTKNSYLTAGLFIPRIGILNENHLPNTFNGNERTRVETYIIPSTWRELGIGFNTHLNTLPLDISVAIVNGLNSGGFEHGSVIRGGRYEGREATGNSMAITGAVQYSINNLTVQISGYAGGSAAMTKNQGDILGMETGPLGTTVVLVEANAQFRKNAFSARVLGTMISISDANRINNVYSNNTPERAYGYYAEAAYDLLFKKEQVRKQSLLAFARIEMLDMNSKIPVNGTYDPLLNQRHIITGFTYLPIPQVAIKADVRFSHTGDPYENISGPVLPHPDFKENNTFINLGAGFSF